ncbi:CHC2 zinc finger domain-containing protein [Mucilaginibacter sp.]|uniref:CHC2 zinc finger domain-containing protein n=1 Tax=Mucilaginibacter sp. TaxID=1882438 RepID=UPI003D12794F
MSADSIVSKIQANADLVKIISKYLILQEGRRILKGSCPFHTDNSDSFMVSPAKNIYKCFGCGKEGGPIEFIMTLEGKSRDEAVNILAKQFGISDAA